MSFQNSNFRNKQNHKQNICFFIMMLSDIKWPFQKTQLLYENTSHKKRLQHLPSGLHANSHMEIFEEKNIFLYTISNLEW